MHWLTEPPLADHQDSLLETAKSPPWAEAAQGSVILSLHWQPDILNRESSLKPIISARPKTPKIDLVDMEVPRAYESLFVALFRLVPHSPVGSALEMENHGELWRAIVGNEAPILVCHRIPTGCRVVSNIDSPQPILDVFGRPACTSVLGLRTETVPENAWQMMWCDTMGSNLQNAD
jgi:hypothetical protein